MMKKLALFLLPFIVAGCAQNLRFHDLGSKENVPAISYEAYFYVAGISERSRAVFLRHPDAEISVEPASREIISTTAAYPEAMEFMKAKRGTRSITTEVVTFSGKPLGYLLSYNRAGINNEYVIVNLYEAGGKVYFSAREDTRADE